MIEWFLNVLECSWKVVECASKKVHCHNWQKLLLTCNVSIIPGYSVIPPTKNVELNRKCTFRLWTPLINITHSKHTLLKGLDKPNHTDKSWHLQIYWQSFQTNFSDISRDCSWLCGIIHTVIICLLHGLISQLYCAKPFTANYPTFPKHINANSS